MNSSRRKSVIPTMRYLIWPKMKEKKARVEDALNATKAAVEEGIIPGGGVAFIRTIEKLNTLKLEGERQYGVQIIKKALEEPMRWIALNAGHDGSIVVEKVKNGKGGFGFDAAKRSTSMTCRRRASSIPPRLPGPRCRTRLPSHHCF